MRQFRHVDTAQMNAFFLCQVIYYCPQSGTLYNFGRVCLSALYICQTINFERLDIGSSYCTTGVSLTNHHHHGQYL